MGLYYSQAYHQSANALLREEDPGQNRGDLRQHHGHRAERNTQETEFERSASLLITLPWTRANTSAGASSPNPATSYFYVIYTSILRIPRLLAICLEAAHGSSGEVRDRKIVADRGFNACRTDETIALTSTREEQHTESGMLRLY
jgi:hypothetical protein